MSHIPADYEQAKKLFEILKYIEDRLGMLSSPVEVAYSETDRLFSWRLPVIPLWLHPSESRSSDISPNPTIWLGHGPHSYVHLLWKKNRAPRPELDWQTLVNREVDASYRASNIEAWLDAMAKKGIFGWGCGSAEFEGSDWRAQVKIRLRDRPDWQSAIVGFHAGDHGDHGDHG